MQIYLYQFHTVTRRGSGWVSRMGHFVGGGGAVFGIETSCVSFPFGQISQTGTGPMREHDWPAI